VRPITPHFAGSVRGAPVDADDGGARRRVHERAAVLLKDQDRMFHTQEDAPQIDVDDLGVFEHIDTEPDSFQAGSFIGAATG
jgi:hypothetical protein